MDAPTAFRLPHLCLPRPGIDLAKWAVIACDQYTAEPEYWADVARTVGAAPSTLQLTFPEVYLGQADAPERIARIQATMRQYLADGLLQDHAGAVLVERQIDGPDGQPLRRRGLMLELDLEHYDFRPSSTSLIRPTEGTIVERLAPRIAVRRGAELELPHILVLIDDPACTVIEPIIRHIEASRGTLAPLYDTALMQGGGHVTGHAVDAEHAGRAVQALAALADPAAFAQRYRVPAGTPPLLFAVGDGNHSLATAKSLWDSVKASVGLQHPSRYALVEVENIHDAALHFAPIHRVLFGLTDGMAGDLNRTLADTFGARLQITAVPTAQAMRDAVAAGNTDTHQAAGLIGPGTGFAVLHISEPPSTLAVGTLQPVIDEFVARGGASHIDYVHGDDVVERLGQAPGQLGIHLPTVAKSDLLRMVVREGPLPRKTFSMGEAHEKRFYVEARRIR
jgi:hypothetical protein